MEISAHLLASSLFHYAHMSEKYVNVTFFSGLETI
jgi:hypothetical protein